MNRKSSIDRKTWYLIVAIITNPILSRAPILYCLVLTKSCVSKHKAVVGITVLVQQVVQLRGAGGLEPLGPGSHDVQWNRTATTTALGTLATFRGWWLWCFGLCGVLNVALSCARLATLLTNLLVQVL